MEEFDWNVANEGHLLEAMMGHKPVGINKYFQMACICNKFNEISQKDILADKIWTHLGTMYNLEALDENESIPFPNTEKDFALPELEFASYISKKDEERKSNQKGRETPKNLKEMKKEEKLSIKKEDQRRDSKESKEKTPIAKKEIKKDVEKPKAKNKNTPGGKEDKKAKEDTPKPSKRPTRGSLKPDDSSSSGKSSPVTLNQTPAKRRRI